MTKGENQRERQTQSKRIKSQRMRDKRWRDRTMGEMYAVCQRKESKVSVFVMHQ